MCPEALLLTETSRYALEQSIVTICNESSEWVDRTCYRCLAPLKRLTGARLSTLSEEFRLTTERYMPGYHRWLSKTDY